MIDFEKLNAQELVFENSDVDVDERQKLRTERPIKNRRTVEAVDGAMDKYVGLAMELAEEQRTIAISQLRNN